MHLATAPKGTRAFICGLSGTQVSAFERDYLADMRPWGVILFARNVADRNQLTSLTDDIREVLGWHAPILIDQEGGRVQRLKPPHWRRYPTAGRFGSMEMREKGAGVEAAEIAAWLIADDLLEVGIDVNCAPVLDLRFPDATDAIGNRSYGAEPELVVKLAGAVIEAYLGAGVLPVIKHIPGHGRAGVDSHELLPRIRWDLETLTRSDFRPFWELRSAPLGMTGHLVFEALDSENPATQSDAVIGYIRDQLGFDGALMTDDLSMGALSGSMDERAERSLGAGCDLVLHCNGVEAEMEELHGAIPYLSGISAQRCAVALRRRGRQMMNRAKMEDRLSGLLAAIPDEEPTTA